MSGTNLHVITAGSIKYVDDVIEGQTAKDTGLIVIIAIVFVTMSRERLVRGPELTNRDSPAVQSRNNHYECARRRDRRRVTPP